MNDSPGPFDGRLAGDPLWRMQSYRLSFEALRLAWDDVTTVARDSRCRGVADQLHRAVGSVGANLAEGYSRGGGRDRARFLEIALGSTREARHWHLAASPVLGAPITGARIDHLNQIARLLLVTIRAERTRKAGEMS